MKRMIVCDTRSDFLRDLRMRILLDDQDVELEEIDTADKIAQLKLGEGLLLICENFLENLPASIEKHFPQGKVLGYCISFQGKSRFSERGIPCLGVVSNSSQLLSLVGSLPEGRIEDARLLPQNQPEEEDDFILWRRNALRAQKGNTPAPPEGNQAEEPPELARRIREKEMAQAEKEADQQILAAEPDHEKTAKIVTVCSAKGGVGKTTISTQLASCMALTSHGRGRFRVCVLDLDIGFGDVCTTLDFEAKGPTMFEWAQDIQIRKASGASLNYTKEEIEGFLQYREDTGLFALLAPARHTDSMDILAEDLQVMVQNLSCNAEFDFLVLDTGNDTKDATILALDTADDILMIATQDVTCAHCLDTFLQTMEAIHFDVKKIRLVINNIMPAKEVGISTAEIEESFPYPCWALIKHDPGIIRSNNYGRPIVYTSSHNMTKQLRSIICRLNDGEKLEAAQPRRGLKRWFKKGKE